MYLYLQIVLASQVIVQYPEIYHVKTINWHVLDWRVPLKNHNNISHVCTSQSYLHDLVAYILIHVYKLMPPSPSSAIYIA